MKSNYNSLGNYIGRVEEKNHALSVTTLLGVSMTKTFIPSVANTVGVDMANYQIVRRNQFACKLMSVGRDEQLPVDLLKDYDAVLVSSAYYVFESLDINILLPEYLMMWFCRKETDRWVGYISGGDVRGGISWDTFCEMQIIVPSIETQREIVKEYHTIVNRITLKEKLNQKLEETAQSLYKSWFVNFDFPNESGQPYKTNGGHLLFNEALEKEIPVGWENGKLSDICSYSSQKEKIANLNTLTYLSTECMLPERGGIQEANNLPNAISTTKFNIGDILISNIRPYFKKIWMATFNGGCSNDLLCLAPNEQANPLYLYFILEQNLFFEYVMKGAKGTKMPRGDKDWIMEFPIVIANSEVINTFSRMVKSLDQKRNSYKHEIVLLRSLTELILSKMSKVESRQTDQVI